ncbi:type II secretion system protein GspM [Deefgea piscis]|uniref:type II secretion system protein GspM n=1 Tax=Deefgea piscis TaxID=2739061 RepID=UPI001C807B42|nr:type II secretion system protein GspM [Deefgea piscis]QZA80456.1 type II secretion system protein M [Deefgea piscis]
MSAYTKYLAQAQSYGARWRMYWLARNPRERKMLLIWAFLVISGLLYFAVYAPLNAQINRLQRQIPQLENQLMAMRGSKPIAIASRAASTQDLRSATFAELSSKGISADVRSISNQQLEVRSNLPSIAEALQLANALRHSVQAKITAIQITPDAASVSLVLVLERQ